jgi:rhodanese-related sulfurtransferase
MSCKTIAIADVRKLIESGKPLDILDVQTGPEFARVHARGARLVPLDQLNPAALATQRNGSNDPIYVICHSGSRAAKACQMLESEKILEAYCVEGGTVAWEKAGLPVERGTTKVISLERQVRIAAGSLVLLGVILAYAVHPWFLGLSAFVGAGLVFAGITDYCGMGMLLAKMPWNR